MHERSSLNLQSTYPIHRKRAGKSCKIFSKKIMPETLVSRCHAEGLRLPNQCVIDLEMGSQARKISVAIEAKFWRSCCNFGAPEFFCDNFRVTQRTNLDQIQHLTCLTLSRAFSFPLRRFISSILLVDVYLMLRPDY